MWVALCVARADGSHAQYTAGEKHAILAMVCAPEQEAENTICALLESNGWTHPQLRRLKLLSEPFHSDDPIMLACHERATVGQGGIVVYSDPVEDT